MATPDDDTTTAPPPVAPPTAAATPDMLAQAQAIAQQFLPAPVQVDTTPVKRSWLSLLGEAVGGGKTIPMSPADEQRAGLRALGDFGTSLMAASHYQPGQTVFSNLAQGFQGAERSMTGSEQMAAGTLAAQQGYQQQQLQNRLEALKQAIPLLRMQQAAGMPNSLLGGGGGGGGTLAATGAPIGGPDPAAALPKDQALAAIVQRESGGRNVNTEILDPQTGKPASTASGYYQMVDGTWQEAARLAGLKNPPPRAIDASRADQDAAASALYDKRGLQDWARSAPATAAPAAPAPYKVASTGATPPPPSGASTAPATTGLPVPPIPPATTPPAGPTAPTIAQTTSPTVTPPAQPTPQQPTQGDQPPAPTGPLTIEQYRAQHPITLDPATYTVPPPDVSALVSARNEAARQLSAARAGLGGDPNKSLSDYNTAAKAVTDAQQAAQTKSLELQQAAQKDAEDRRDKTYGDELTRQQQAKLEADKLAQAAAEAEKQRQAAVALKVQEAQQAIELAKVNAGQTWHQKLQEQSAQNAQENTLKPMAEQAAKAHNMNLSLAQLQPLLQDLPPGGGALGTVLNDHPELAPLFNSAGILNDKSADAVRLVNGLVANISTQMKPTGLGALREYEWDAFKSQLPSMLSTPAGQQKAIALLMNMNNRIGSEASWMNNYFSRKVPDDMSPKPGAMMPAHNLESDNPTESVQQRMDRELGPIVPSAPPGSNQAQWEQSLPPGKPYYKAWALPDPKNPGQPLRDQTGNVRTTKTLEVRPWQ